MLCFWFAEFVLDSTMANAAGFQHLCGPFVTILSSKNSQRYRIQSDNLPALWLLIQSLENRLQAMFDRSANTNSDSGSPLEFSYSASLPLHEYFTEIETHFHKRNKLQLLMVSRYHRRTWDEFWKCFQANRLHFHVISLILFIGTIGTTNNTASFDWKKVIDTFQG